MATKKRKLPILVEGSIGQTQVLRTDLASKFDMAVRQSGEKRVTCTVGCSWCCYHPIHISVFEGVLIYRWLVSQNQWTLKLREKLKEVSDRQYGVSFEVWLLALIPCPLLDENKRCSAYKARPLICRTYYSVGDPFNCHPHRLGTETEIVQREAVVDRYHQEQEKLLRRHKLQFLTMPIGTAVLLGAKLCEGEIAIDAINETLYHEYIERG